MSITILSILLFLIFSLLAGFHFYWFFGGTWGLKKVIPTKNNTTSTLAIPEFATLVVALVLLAFGLLYLLKSGFINKPIPNWLTDYGYWLVPLIFVLRAIGEFNYVGFFKKVKNTEFAKADSKWFSPLCLLIGLLGILIQIMSK